VGTALLLACALLLDRALERRAGAGLRILLYAPVALRVLLPSSLYIPVASGPRAAFLTFLPDALSSAAEYAAGSAAVGHTTRVVLADVYLGVATALAALAAVRRVRLARALGAGLRAARVPSPMPWPVMRHPELGPMVVGLVAPRIVVPDALLREDRRAALACVLRHEAAHLLRRDPWLAAAVHALRIVAWPVAPLWIATARVRLLMELACDEAALAGAPAEARRHYGHVLLDIAEHGLPSASGGGALAFGSLLRARIEALASQRQWPRRVQTCLVATAVACLGACSSVVPATPPAPAAAAPHPAAATAAGDAPAGHLAPEAIQAVVHAKFGLFRRCYEDAQRTRKDLRGVVRVWFVIRSDGSVAETADRDSDLPDPNVVRCVMDGFARLSFPAPEDGEVNVLYPIQFTPDD
jgi:hypothetical protein